MRLWKTLLFWTVLGLLVGVVWGAGQALTVLRANLYAHYGMGWLAVDTATRYLGQSALWGLALGLLSGSLVLIASPACHFVARWLERRVASTRIADSRSAEALAMAMALGTVALVLGWVILDDHFIPFDYTRRYWVLNIGWAGACVTGGVLLYRLLVAIPLGEWIRRSGRKTLVLAMVPVVVALTALQVVRVVQRPMPPAGAASILLLTVDTTRADHLSTYGYGRETTPHLSQLAESGRVYAYCYSQAPVTSSSFSSIMSGLPPRETGTYGNDPVSLQVNTLAEYLANAGYETAAVVSNFVLRKGKNHDQGFRYYDDAMDDHEAVRRTPERIGAHTTDAAIRWLESAPRDRPFFLWVHYQDPHGPYTPPREYQSLFLDQTARGTPLRIADSVKGMGGIPTYQVLSHHREFGYYVAQYDAEIRYYDDCLHGLVEHLREGGWWDSSLVFLTSDHGEGMGEHDYYFAHGDFLYPGQLRVPLLLWGAGVAPGVRDSTLAGSGDIVPTILAAAGIRPVEPLPGRNLLGDEPGAVTGIGRWVPPEALVFSETFVSDNYKAALTSPAIQFVFDHFNGDYQPYDPVTQRFLDPDALPEGVDLPRIAARLDQLRNRSASREGLRGKSRQEIELMKSLGYVN